MLLIEKSTLKLIMENCLLEIGSNLIWQGKEAWRKRKYPKSFVAKLNDSEGESAETQVWLDYALACEYIDEFQHKSLYEKYDNIIGMLVNMQLSPDKWKL